MPNKLLSAWWHHCGIPAVIIHSPFLLMKRNLMSCKSTWQNYLCLMNSGQVSCIHMIVNGMSVCQYGMGLTIVAVACMFVHRYVRQEQGADTASGRALHALFHIVDPGNIPEVLFEDAMTATNDCLQHATLISGRWLIKEVIKQAEECM